MPEESVISAPSFDPSFDGAAGCFGGRFGFAPGGGAFAARRALASSFFASSSSAIFPNT